VLKADAYGLGTVPVAKALSDEGARTFFVAHPNEARAVRAVLPGAIIYVLNGLASGGAPALAETGARPVLGSLSEIEEWAGFTRANDLAGEAALHVDTGMNRLGITPGEAAELAGRRNLGFVPSLIMSHLACADTPDHPANARQLNAFRNVSALFPEMPASLANSAATLSGGPLSFDLCRPGIALYGGNPFTDVENPMQPVVKLEARIIQIRAVHEGEKVGYGAAETVLRPTLLAVLSIGYADGLIRAAGSSDTHKGADAVIAGTRCAFVGRVSMDVTAVDITALPPGSVAPGDYATILGDGITMDELGAAAGTIGYEVLTRLGSRLARTYVG
jgi:alanine racemase